MALPSPLSAADKIYQASMTNITSGTAQYIALVAPGRVKRMSAVPSATTATGNATFQLAYAPPGSTTFTNVVSGLITMPSGTAAGGTIQTDVTPSTDASVQDGGCLRVTMGGTATGGGAPQVSIVVGV